MGSDGGRTEGQDWGRCGDRWRSLGSLWGWTAGLQASQSRQPHRWAEPRSHGAADAAIAAAGGRGAAAPLQVLMLGVRPPPPQAPRTKWPSCCWAASSAASGAWRSSSSSSTGTPTSWYGKRGAGGFSCCLWRRVSLCSRLSAPLCPPLPPSAPLCPTDRRLWHQLLHLCPQRLLPADEEHHSVRTPKSPPPKKRLMGAAGIGGGGRSPPSPPQGRRVG